MTAPIAVYLIGICVGWILHRLMRLVDAYFAARQIDATLADGDEVLCTNATVIRERTGEVAWVDNDRLPQNFKGG